MDWFGKIILFRNALKLYVLSFVVKFEKFLIYIFRGNSKMAIAKSVIEMKELPLRSYKLSIHELSNIFGGEFLNLIRYVAKPVINGPNIGQMIMNQVVDIVVRVSARFVRSERK
jgi:hypothetical protein